MAVRTAPKGPAKLALRLVDGKVVDTGEAQDHEAVVVERPVLVTVRAKPGSRVIVPLVREAHSKPVLEERREFLDEQVVQFLAPLAREDRTHFLATHGKFRPVPPSRVLAIDERDAIRVHAVPRVLRHADLRDGRFLRERWEWRVLFHSPPRLPKNSFIPPAATLRTPRDPPCPRYAVGPQPPSAPFTPLTHA